MQASNIKHQKVLDLKKNWAEGIIRRGAEIRRKDTLNAADHNMTNNARRLFTLGFYEKKEYESGSALMLEEKFVVELCEKSRDAIESMYDFRSEDLEVRINKLKALPTKEIVFDDRSPFSYPKSDPNGTNG